MATTLESTIIRTFYQMGLAFDVVDGIPATINVSIDGKPIYNGPVPGVSSPYPSYSTRIDGIPPYTGPPGAVYSIPVIQQTLFTWPVDIDFMGPVTMTIEVMNCTLLLGDTRADYMENTGKHTDLVGNLDHYQEIDGIRCQDSFTDVKLNGQPLQRGIKDEREGAPPLIGKWVWQIPSGSMFETTIHINPGWL